MSKNKTDKYKAGRVLYCIEAALEYFIAIMVGETYLAKIASELGASDALTGVLYSFVSLGCAFQMIAIFFARKTPVKRWVTPLHILSQLLFTLIWAVPLIEGETRVKLIVFIALLLLGQIIHNVINPAKINWFMSLVDNGKRGRFTAKKEMISLIGGMCFSFCMGNVIDLFEERGEIRTAFVIACATVFVLMLLHTLTLIFTVEKPTEKSGERVSEGIVLLLHDKTLFKVIGVSVLWYAVNYMTTPFYGSYRIGELGFSMTFCSLLAIAYSIIRSLVSPLTGRYADKRGFTRMLFICFSIQGVALLINTFTAPSNGHVFYTAYYVLNAIAMAGINSGQINLIYDYVDEKKRTSALALSHAVSGVVGFLTTLAVTPLVSYIQKNGNRLFGIYVYAQQLLSAMGVVGITVILIYIGTVLKNKHKGEAK